MKGDNMRLTNLYQVYDLKAEAISGPILSCSKDAVAIRHFHDLLGDKRTSVAQYPDDFQLLYLGYQDEETGEITPTPNRTVVTTGKGWYDEQRAGAEAELRATRHPLKAE